MRFAVLFRFPAGALCLLLCAAGTGAFSQQAAPPTPPNAAQLPPSPSQSAVVRPSQSPAARQKLRDRRFLLRRGIGSTRQSTPAAAAQGLEAPLAERLRAARAQQGAAVARRLLTATPLDASTTTWQSAGPIQLSTPAYGLVTGRVSSLAVDPNDTSGNTVYLGATGGGVWKSTNAAGNAGSVSFLPLTDDLSVFANSFTSIPSLSIGAVTVQPGNAQLLLAGTGDPNNALDSYYGVGILRSTNGGSSWSLITSSIDGFEGYTNYKMAGAGFAGFAWSTTTANLVVAAVSSALEGEIVNPASTSTTMTGLYYSTDAGQTWHLATISDGGSGNIVQSPEQTSGPPGNAATAVVWNPQRSLFFAAVRFHGYYSSPDGITWTRLANQPGANLTTQLCPTNPSGTGSTSCPIYRGALAVQPETGDTFALTTDLNNIDQGIYRDQCSASGVAVSSCPSSTITFADKITDTALDASDGTIPEADYNLTLSAVASQQDTILFAGTGDLYRCSLANSCTWRNTTNYGTCAAAEVAPSTHAIDSTFGANGLVYFGNDGGLWRTTDTVGQTGPVCAPTDSSHFQNLNGGIGSLAEISHLAVSPSNPSLVLAGMGEFGVVASESGAAQGGTGAWQQLLTGEGSLVAIDPTTPTNWYADSGAGVAIFSCADGGNCDAADFGSTPVIGRAQVDDDADYFLDAAPWMLDPLDPGNILLGTCRMWLGPVTGNWGSSDLISVPLDNEGGSFCDGNAALRSVGAGGSYNSAQGGEQMYAGMAGPLDGGGSVPGHVYGATVPQGGGVQTWTDLWRNPVTNAASTQFNAPGSAISSITVDPHDTTGETVYVTIAGFPSGTAGLVYRSTDGGAHWSNITNSLPFAPINSIVVDPSTASTVYVGGDFGVYSTTDIASCSNSNQLCWGQLGAGLPNAPVTDLTIATSGGASVLEAATYGRGIWTLGLATTAALAQATLTPATYTFPGQAVGSQSPSVGSFILRNTGSVALAIAQISTTSDFAQTNNCGSTLATGTTCTIAVTFTPSATGTRTGTLTVRANTQSGTLASTLNGTGLTPGALGVSPGALSFPSTATGSSSAAMNLTLTNTGGAPLQLGADTVVGADPNDFNLGSGSTCGSTLASGASCTVPVVFTPSQTGSRTAQLQLASSAQGSPALVTLAGSGITPAALTLQPTSLTFPQTAQNSSSAPQSIAVTDTGGAAAQLGTPSVSGDYSVQSSTCGASLAAGASCSVAIVFAPTASGSRAGLFTLPSSSIPAQQVTAALGGTGSPPPSVTLAPTSLSFPAQGQGTTSAAQALTVTNTAGSPAQLGVPAVSGDFAVASNSCPATLAVGSSCTLGVTFTPAGVGTRSGVLTLPVGNTGITAALSGTGTAPPLLAFSPASLSFAATAENTTAPAQSVTVSNSGGSPATLASVTVNGAFALAANSCPASLAAGASCSLSISFTPPGTGAYSGAATFTGSFSNSPASIALSGQGATPPAATLLPGTLTFADTPEGSTSGAQSVTLTSTGGVAVALGSPTVSPDYQISANTCPATLAPGSTCAISVLFHPAATGARPGTLSQPGNMAGSPLTVSLSGNGLAPGVLTLSPASLNFGAHVIGTTSAPSPVTLTNTGGSSIAVGTPTTSGDYSLSASSCGSTLAAAQSCTLSLVFSPVAAGDRPGQLTVPGPGSGSAAVTTLDGTGATPAHLSIAPASLAFGTVALGASATSSVTVTNTGGTPADLGGVAAGGDFAVTGGTCSTATPIAAAGGTCTVAITFTPTVAGTRSATLTLTNDGTPGTVQAGLAGAGAAPGTLALTPASLAFGPVVLGTASAAQTVTATNSGGLPVSLGTAAVSGSGFAIAGNSCSATLAAGATCTVQLTFTPAAAGSTSGTFSLPGQYTGSSQAVSLLGSAVTPGALSFSPSPVAFGSVVTGASATQAVSIENSGGAPVTLGQPSVSTGFSLSGSCGATLAPSATCVLQVTFAPTGAGAVSGLLTVPASVGGNAATDALSGTGILPGALAPSPATLTFAATALGTSDAAQTVTFRNSGGLAVPLGAPQSSPADYSVAANTCGNSLAAGATCTVGVLFSPAAVGNRSGQLVLASDAPGGPSASVSLDGTGLADAHLAFAPASVNFGGQDLNTTSAAQSLTLTNSGGVSTSLGMPVLSGPYAITSNSCAGTLAAGAACHIAVQFAPTADGSQPGTLSMASTSGTPSASATLAGNGLVLALLPASVTFSPPVAVGASSAPIQVAVENLGPTPIALGPLAVTGDFAITASSCGGTLGPSSSCVVSLVFTPTAAGVRTGTLTASDGAETAVAPLTGTGLGPATDTLSAGSLVFNATAIGTDSSPLSVVVTNSGDATLSGITTQVSGPFLAANNCGATLGGHLSCSLAVQFAPVALGAASGTLTITDALRTQTVALSGTGAAPPQAFAAPDSINFGPYAQGIGTPPQTVILSNGGQTAMTGMTVTITGADYALSSNTCGLSLGPGASCQVAVVFTPTVIGNREGVLTVGSSTLSAPLTVALSGAGEDFQLSVVGAGTAVVTDGQTAAYTLAITPVGASAGTLVLACTGAPVNSVCTANPSSITVSGQATGSVQLSIATATGSASAQTGASSSRGSGWAGPAALALLLPLSWLPRRHRRRFLLAFAAVALVAMPIACGVHASGTGGGGGTTGPGQTASGSYPITVTGSFPGAQRTATVTLVVQ